MSGAEKTYKPINCEFHDKLLDKATLKKACEITYNATEGQKTTIDIIVDVYTKNKAEYMQLSQGLIIRLDHIISVDGDVLPDSNCFI